MPLGAGPAPAAAGSRDQLEMPLAPATDAETLVRRFTAALEQAGGAVVERDGLEPMSVEPPADGPRRGVVSCVPGLPISTLTIAPDAARERLDQIGLAIVPARFGVAENGAVWVDERDLPHRAVPFIAERLVVVLPKREIVALTAAAGALAELCGRHGVPVFTAGAVEPLRRVVAERPGTVEGRYSRMSAAISAG